MKNLLAFITIFLFVSGYTASAQMMGQDDNQNPQQGMMMQRGRMMQGMMGMCPMCGQMMNQEMPMRKYGMMVNMLPGMQEKLALNDNQVEQLLDLQTDFKKQQIDMQAELRKSQMKLKNLLKNNSSADEVEGQLETCSDIRINMKMAAYTTASEMKDVLNEDQQEQLQNMMMQQNMMQGGMMQQDRNRMMQNRGGMMNNQNNN